MTTISDFEGLFFLTTPYELQCWSLKVEHMSARIQSCGFYRPNSCCTGNVDRGKWRPSWIWKAFSFWTTPYGLQCWYLKVEHTYACTWSCGSYRPNGAKLGELSALPYVRLGWWGTANRSSRKLQAHQRDRCMSWAMTVSPPLNWISSLEVLACNRKRF